MLPFSTGVIMETLPHERIEAALPAALADARPDGWAARRRGDHDDRHRAQGGVAARCSSAAARSTVTGISKGAGMIHPNMATMLGFVATDAAVEPALMQRLVQEAADESFNRITIDGDTSTNDSFVLIATHRAGNAPVRDLDSGDGRLLRDAVVEVSRRLAQAIVRDGEGATKFITVRIEGGASVAECRQVAFAISHSPLVKTAFFASDPNLGRILAAVGYAGIADLDQTRIDLFLDDVHVVEGGGRRAELPRGRRPARDEAERDHGARRPAPRHRRDDGLDLRPQLRLRQDQRRLPLLIDRALACRRSGVGAPQRK